MKYLNHLILIIVLGISLLNPLSAQTPTKLEIINQLNSELQSFNRYKNKFVDPIPTIPSFPTCSPACNNNTINNDGRIKITFFRPINGVKTGTPSNSGPTDPSTMTSINNSSFDNNNATYTIGSFQQHKTIPSDEDGNQAQFFEFRFGLEYTGPEGTDLYYTILYQNESYKHNEIIYSSNTHPGFEGMLFKSGENFYGSWGYLFGFKKFNMNTTSREVFDYFKITYTPKNEPIAPWLLYPRMGDYKFLLVVTDNPNDFNGLDFLIDPSKKYSSSQPQYLSPFYWRNLTGSEMTNNTAIAQSTNTLSIKADIMGCTSIDGNSEVTNCPFSKRTNASSANVVDYNIVPQFWKLDDFTQTDYNWGASFFREDELRTIAVDLGKPDNVVLDDSNTTPPYPILLINRKSDPECSNTSSLRRDHAGVEYIQQMYGKFTAYIEFPKMYNKHHIWKGITNTFWAGSEGFSAFYNSCADPQPANISNRFEHDFEFFAENFGCRGCFNQNGYDQTNPDRQYNHSDWNSQMARTESKIRLRISNFDYACDNEVDNFIPFMGSATVNFEGKSFLLCRNCDIDGSGESLYIEYKDNLAFDDNLFFNDDDTNVTTVAYSIEWTPTELIFRIDGIPYGYFNSKYTRISNFPMRFIAAQHMFNGTDPKPEPFVFHHFQFLPFWTDDIVGTVTRFTIE